MIIIKIWGIRRTTPQIELDLDEALAGMVFAVPELNIKERRDVLLIYLPFSQLSQEKQDIIVEARILKRSADYETIKKTARSIGLGIWNRYPDSRVIVSVELFGATRDVWLFPE